MNLITKKTYDEIKNATVMIVFFQDGKRTLTYSGLNYAKAMKEMIFRAARGESAYVFPEDYLTMDEHLLWDEDEFLAMLKKKQEEKREALAS